MTSIKNDAFVVGTAAVGAAAANVAAQNAAAIKIATSKVTTPVADAFVATKDTVFKASTYKGLVEDLKKSLDKKTYDKVFNAVKNMFRKDSERIIASSISKEAHALREAQLKDAFGKTAKEKLADFGKALSDKLGSAKDSVKGFFRKAVDKNTYTQVLEGVKNKAGSVKDCIKKSRLGTTSWKTVGKYAGVAAAVALTAVVAKRIYNAVTNKD